MSYREKIKDGVLTNKQIGNVFSYEQDGELYWSSVAVQKWGNIIKVYVDEILESQMDTENYTRDEVLIFQNIDDAIDYIESNTKVSIDRMKPCKGQKIFNPEFCR